LTVLWGWGDGSPGKGGNLCIVRRNATAEGAIGFGRIQQSLLKQAGWSTMRLDLANGRPSNLCLGKEPELWLCSICLQRNCQYDVAFDAERRAIDLDSLNALLDLRLANGFPSGNRGCLHNLNSVCP